MHSAKRRAETEAVFQAGAVAEAVKPVAGAAAVDADEAFKETLREAPAAVSVTAGQPVHRVAGSRTLIEPNR